MTEGEQRMAKALEKAHWRIKELERENEANERNLCQLTDDLAAARRENAELLMAAPRSRLRINEKAQFQEQIKQLEADVQRFNLAQDILEGAIKKLEDENAELRQKLASVPLTQFPQSFRDDLAEAIRLGKVTIS